MLLNLTRRSWTFDLQPYLLALALGATLGLASVVSPLAGLAIIVVGVGLLVILRNPLLLLYMHALAVVWLSGVPRDHLIPILRPNEPLLALAAGMGFIIIILRHSKTRAPTQIITAIVVLALGTSILPVLLYALRGFRIGISELFSLLGPLQYLVVTWLFANLPRSQAERMQVLQVMIAGVTMVALVGILEALGVGFVHSFIAFMYPSIHQSQAADVGRVISILGAWNSLGNFLMISMLFMWMLLPTLKTPLYRYNTIIALGLSAFCLLASGSFASIIGLVIAFGISRIFERRGLRQMAYMLGGLVVAGIIMFPLIAPRFEYQFGEDGSRGFVPQTLTYRFYLWETIFLPALERNNNWIWGINPNLTGGVFTWAWTENQYLYLLVRSGVISLIGHLLWVAITAAWLYRRAKHSTGLARVLSVSLFSLLCALTIMGMSNEVFTNSGSIDYFWMLLGIAVKADSI